MSVHVIPQNDEIEHERSAECICQPRVEWVHPESGEVYPRGPVVTHNAFDCREVSEQVTGEKVAPGLGWETIEV